MSTINLPELAPIPGQFVLIDLSEPGDPGDDRALAGYLAGYSGTTLAGYRLDLRQWVAWITNLCTAVFAAEPAHIELYAPCCENDGKARISTSKSPVSFDIRPL